MSPLLTGFPFSAGSSGTPKATVTGTTGSPTIDTSSRPGKTIYKFTGSGTITIGVAGTCEYLVIGGGAVNGAGGYIYNTSAVLPAGTLAVTVGAGIGFTGTSGGSGNPSQLGNVVALAGGNSDFNYQGGTIPFQGGSSGGSRVTSTTRAAALSGAQGNNGGQGVTGMMGPSMVGGGGGAGGVGGNASSSGGGTGGNGGAGAANSITGTSVTYAAGAGGYGSTVPGTPTGNGAANTGNGGSITGDNSSTNSGGSGFVVVVIG